MIKDKGYHTITLSQDQIESGEIEKIIGKFKETNSEVEVIVVRTVASSS